MIWTIVDCIIQINRALCVIVNQSGETGRIIWDCLLCRLLEKEHEHGIISLFYEARDTKPT